MSTAIEDLKNITYYISRDSPKYAKILISQIFEMVSHLEKFPKFGRTVPEYNNPKIREIIYKNYRIVYQIKEEYLEIITVIQGSRTLKI